jgi:DNA-binding MarR family transcriptional regulator
MEEPGFLVGAPLAILGNILQRRVFEGLAASGFDDLSPSYLPVFQVLAPDGDSISDVARRSGTTKQAMGYLVAYLLKQGYVERVPHPADARVSRIRRTARGWEVNRRSRELVEEAQADWGRLIGPDKMIVLVRILRELSAALGAEYRGSVADVAVLAARGVPPRRSPR